MKLSQIRGTVLPNVMETTRFMPSAFLKISFMEANTICQSYLGIICSYVV